MSKEELRELIKEEEDNKVEEALWELYELKFGKNNNTGNTGITYSPYIVPTRIDHYEPDTYKYGPTCQDNSLRSEG